MFLLVVLSCRDRLTPVWVGTFQGALAPLRPSAEFLGMHGVTLLVYLWSYCFQLGFTQYVMHLNMRGRNPNLPPTEAVTAMKHAQYVSFAPVSKQLEPLNLDGHGPLYMQWKQLVEAQRVMGQEVLNENLLQLFLQTTVYSMFLAIAQDSGTCGRPLVALGRNLGCPKLSVVLGVVLGVVMLLPKFVASIKVLAKYRDPADVHEYNLVDASEKLTREQVAQECRAYRKGLILVTALGLLLLLAVLAKLVMVHVCPSHLWNLLTVSCVER